MPDCLGIVKILLQDTHGRQRHRVSSREDKVFHALSEQGGDCSLDHIVLGHEEYFSFADAGLLQDSE
jgi:DNA repair protein RadC